MIMPAMLLTSLGLVIPVADTVPRYDVRKTCRAAVTLAAGSEGRTVESCMAGEEVARKFAYAYAGIIAASAWPGEASPATLPVWPNRNIHPAHR